MRFPGPRFDPLMLLQQSLLPPLPPSLLPPLLLVPQMVPMPS